MKLKDLKKLKPDRIPLLPSRTLILTCYNKYRKGYHYLNDVIELRSIILPVVKVFLNNTEKFRIISDYYNKHTDNPLKMLEYDKISDKFCYKADGLLSGQNGHWIRYLRERINELEKAKTDLDILIAIDKVFNYTHDQGPILIHMVKGQGRNDFERLQGFLDTLDILRDW